MAERPTTAAIASLSGFQRTALATLEGLGIAWCRGDAVNRFRVESALAELYAAFIEDEHGRWAFWHALGCGMTSVTAEQIADGVAAAWERSARFRTNDSAGTPGFEPSPWRR